MTVKIEPPQGYHKAASSRKEHSVSIQPSADIPEQDGNHDDASIVEPPPQRLPCKVVEHLEAAARSSIASESHSSLSRSLSASKEDINLQETHGYTPIVNTPPQHEREGIARHLETSIFNEYCLPVGTHSPSSTTGSAERHQSKFSGRQPLYSSRVMKTPARIHPQQCTPHRASRPQKSLSSYEQGPSEEDLLYLLMFRSRETAKSIRKLESIENQNRRLHQEKTLSEARLEKAEIAYRQLSAKQAIGDKSLEAFKEKYYKLKRWALEANKDCEILQNKSVDLNQSLTELTNERVDLRTRLHDLGNFQQNNLGQMDKVRSLINETRQLATINSSDLSRKDGLLQEKTEHLKREQARGERLEAHIAQLERHKIGQDQRFQHERNRQNKVLQELVSELTRLAVKDTEATLESKKILESVKACQILLENDPTLGPELIHLKETMKSMTELISSRLESTLQRLKEDVSEQVEKVRTTGETDEIEQALLESNTELVKSREEAAGLSQIIEHSKVVIELLRSGKQVAEDREAYLKNNTEKLIEALSEGKETSQKQFDHLKATNDALQTKCEAANSQATEYKVQNDEKSGQIKLLEIQRDNLQKEKDSIAEQLRNLMEEMLLFRETTKRQIDEKVWETLAAR